MEKFNESHGLDEVNVCLHGTEKTLPLIITPRWDDSLEFISSWLESNRPWVEQQILRHGAVLIRGFRIHSAPDFERVTLSLQPNLCDAYRGTSPRSVMPGTKYAFSAADVPVEYPIAQHLEMSFLKAPPRHLYFGCIKESKTAGGETALCDFRRVYQEISPELRSKLDTKKVKYTRRHYKVGETLTYDVGSMLSWPQLFGTSDPAEVEQICKEEGSPHVQWVGENNDTFLQEWVDEPFQQHPITGELAWFNHSNVFHWTTFPAELYYSFRRIRNFKLFVHFVLVSLFTIIKYAVLGHTMALNTTFADGTPITAKEMDEVRGAIHKNMIFSRWKKGDILCIDNFSTSHGRQPTYDKGRKVLVAWSQPHNKTEPIVKRDSPVCAVGTVGTVKMDASGLKNEDSVPPGLVASSPENSQSSTLTSQEANDLREAFLSNRFEAEMALAFSKRAASKKETHKRHLSSPNLLQADSDFWRQKSD